MDNRLTFKNYFWNIVSGVIRSSELIILTIFASWRFDIAIVGIITIAFSLSNIFTQMGGMSIRIYQIAHVNLYSFRSFHRARCFTVGIMMAVISAYLAFCFLSDLYSLSKCITVLLICLWFAVETYEDVYASFYHAIGRLYVGKLICAVRCSALILSFIITAVITNNIIIACGAALTVSIAVMLILLNRFVSPEDMNIEGCCDVPVMRLVKQTLSVTVIGVLYLFLAGLPKYVIDFMLDDGTLGVFGYIFMPVFALELISSFIYQPKLPEYSQNWTDGNIKTLCIQICQQIILIMLITLACAVAAYYIGIPILSVIYNIDLSAYRQLIAINMLGGGFWTVGGFLSTTLIIEGGERLSALIHILETILGTLFHIILIRAYGMTGAVYAYFITMLLYAAVFSLCNIIKINHCKNA